MPRSPWISDLHWKRDGQQPRSQKTQEALLDAAEVLFYESGADATSVVDVAKKAGVSVGAVYHHFRDKKALLYALFERMSKQYETIGRDAVDAERWEGASILDVLRGFLEFSLELGRVRPGFKKSGLEAAQIDPVLRQHFEELQARNFKGLHKLLLTRKGEMAHPNPKFAAAFIIDQLSSMLRSRNDQLIRKTQIAPCTDEKFVSEALHMALLYLQVEVTSRGGPVK